MTARSAKGRAARRCVTLAEVCRAIAEGDLPARQQGYWYTIRKRDVANYLSRFGSQANLLGQVS